MQMYNLKRHFLSNVFLDVGAVVVVVRGEHERDLLTYNTDVSRDYKLGFPIYREIIQALGLRSVVPYSYYRVGIT